MLSVCMCARFQANPKECHLVAVKRILRYLVHTPNLGLWYPKGATFDLLGYSDSDYAGCKVDQKSTTGTCQLLGRSLVSWSSKKQNSVALSTAEAEYIQALQTFPDLPDGHATLGWIYLTKGQPADARQELDTALRLDPEALDARVYLGVLFAREGDFPRALALWRQVRTRNPRYPNIDRLISEAEARRRQGN